MRPLLVILFVGFALSFVGHAQTVCSPELVTRAAQRVAAVRHLLHEQAVAEDDRRVPATVAGQLQAFKGELAQTAEAAFACAAPAATPEEIEGVLAKALHANLTSSADTAVLTRGKKQLGAYGSDLAVQVFPLYSSPRYYEVDFRYGIACGDDNLLLVFTADPAPSAAGKTAWREILRWDASGYTNVRDAFGDFVLLTPLSGFPGKRDWRFAVAHGQPGCGTATSASRFDLDVLEPGADPARPQVVLHLEQPYNRDQVPRLSTTEDTLTLELNAPQATAKDSAVPSHKDIYRYRIGRDNHVEPLSTSEGGSAGAAGTSPNVHSPQ